MEIPSVIPASYEEKIDNYPFPAPFILSSMEREWCRHQNVTDSAIVFIKRRHLEENLKTISQEIGMDEAEQKKFLDWWCSPKGDAIRAESDPFFNLRNRAESWMEKRKPNNTNNNKSRLEKYAESARQFIKGQTISRAGEEPHGFGYADIPDEQ